MDRGVPGPDREALRVGNELHVTVSHTTTPVVLQLPLYKETGFIGIWYGFSLWNHWLPAIVVTGCPGNSTFKKTSSGPVTRVNWTCRPGD